MTVVSSRALHIAESIESATAVWTPVSDQYSFTWPRAAEIAVRSAWRVGDVPVALVHDERIMRDYLVADGADGVALMATLVAEGTVADPAELIAVARRATGWAALGDSLYDVIAGCVDPQSDEVVDVWVSRATDEHPLIRLAAAWTGPYLPVGRVRSQLAELGSTDPDPQVRTASQESLGVLEGMD